MARKERLQQKEQPGPSIRGSMPPAKKTSRSEQKRRLARTPDGDAVVYQDSAGRMRYKYDDGSLDTKSTVDERVVRGNTAAAPPLDDTLPSNHTDSLNLEDGVDSTKAFDATGLRAVGQATLSGQVELVPMEGPPPPPQMAEVS